MAEATYSVSVVFSPWFYRLLAVLRFAPWAFRWIGEERLARFAVRFLADLKIQPKEDSSNG